MFCVGKSRFLWVLVLWGFSGTALGKSTRICGPILLQGSNDIKFTKSEIALICGDPKQEAWDNVSDTQAMFHLKTFLKQRGYHSIKTTRVSLDWLVDVGAPTRVTGFSIEGAPEGLQIHKLRNIQSEIVTSALLDDVEARLLRPVQALGYACPTIELRADPNSGHLVAVMNAGKKGLVANVSVEDGSGLGENMLRRYDAFLVGVPFNGDLLRLTENRILSENVLQNTHFTLLCQGEEVLLKQRVIAGAPRQISIGFGINTERWLSARASWKHLRLGKSGSSIEFTAAASFKVQDFSATSKWYLFSFPTRFHFIPNLSIKRENEILYERYSGSLQFVPATTWDNHWLGVSFNVGPSMNFLKTVRGSGPEESTFLSLNGQLKLETHDHELYRQSPRSGFEVNLNSSVTQNDLISDVTAQRIRLDYEYLWNALNLNPPWAILGIRGAFAVTHASEGSRPLLPSHFRHFLGGSSDLRGFARAELPGEEGALTAAFSGLEARFSALLPHGLEPLLFFDVGKMGRQPLSLDPPVYGSLGGGIRWDSPIGVFRTTLAKGYVANEDPPRDFGWTFYFSYGDEF